MSMSDPIADMLTRIRNAVRAGHDMVEIPASRMSADICRVLKQQGFIENYAQKDRQAQPVLALKLRYTPDRSSVVQGLRRVSKPSVRRYVRSRNIPLVRNGLGIAILSTSKGIMTGKEARDARLGGEILCEIW